MPGLEDEIIINGDKCFFSISEIISGKKGEILHSKQNCDGYNKNCEYYLPQKDIYTADKPLSKTGL